MLFWTRSLVCIGAVVVLAEGVNFRDVVPPTQRLAVAVARRATGEAERYCQAEPARCLAVANQALQAGHGTPGTTIGSEAAASFATGAGHTLAAKRHFGVPRPSDPGSDLSLPPASPR